MPHTIEATVRPGQITAKVSEIPRVTGEATVTIEPQRVILELNTAMLDAKIEGAVGRKVATMPLTSGGARPGATSMPRRGEHAGGEVKNLAPC